MLLLLPSAFGLRLTRVSVPAFRKKGESALLECKYELKKLHRLQLQDSEEQEHLGEDNVPEYSEEEESPGQYNEKQQLMIGDDGGEQRRWTKVHRRSHQRRRGVEHEFYETSEALYSVKWYKDNEEFYRYLPKSNPPQHSYRVEGIRVDVSI